MYKTAPGTCSNANTLPVLLVLMHVYVPVKVGVMLLDDLASPGAGTAGVGASTGGGGSDAKPGKACGLEMLTWIHRKQIHAPDCREGIDCM